MSMGKECRVLLFCVGKGENKENHINCKINHIVLIPHLETPNLLKMQRQDQVGQLGWGFQFGEKIEGDMDLPCQGTMWWKNSQCGAVHHILENWSYEQDTDFKEHLCSWLLAVKGCRFVGFLFPCQQLHRSALLPAEPLLFLKNWMKFQWYGQILLRLVCNRFSLFPEPLNLRLFYIKD